MDPVDGNIELQQILLKQTVIVSSMLQEYLYLLKRHILSDTINKGAEPLA